MNCYEIAIDLKVRYEMSDGKYHYMDPRCTTWTETAVIRATAYAWAKSAARAVAMALELDYERGDFSFDVMDKRVCSISICATDEDITEESIEIETIETP